MFLKYILSIFLLLFSTAIFAETWSTTNIAYLTGDSYVLEDKKQDIITVEHAGGWKYGDNFLFMDIESPFSGGTEVYTELQPRLSLPTIFTGKPLSFWFVKDVLFATQLNYASATSSRAYLYGIGFALNIPNATFFDVNFYRRSDRSDGRKDTWQLNIAGHVPIKFSNQIIIEVGGFLDWIGPQGKGLHTNFLFQPQLLLDIGNFWQQPGRLYAGMEYQYWDNKFGVKDKKDSFFQAMFKFVF